MLYATLPGSRDGIGRNGLLLVLEGDQKGYLNNAEANDDGRRGQGARDDDKI